MRDLFEKEIISRISTMADSYIDIISKDIHEQVGIYPKNNHRMPVCCSVMRALMSGDDEVIAAPPKGNGATLTIRYYKKNH